MIGTREPPTGVPRWQRELLPAGLFEPPGSRRSARDLAVDALMMIAAAGISAALLVDSWDDHNGLTAAIDIAVGSLAWIALWWRRRHPAALGIGCGILALVSAGAAGPALFATFNAAIRASTRVVAVVAALGVVGSVTMPLLYPGSDPFLTEIVLGVAITAVAVGWGLFVRARRALVLSLRERAERREVEERLGVEQAREAERRRIAREMHDVLAHRVSLLSVHAGALEFRPDASPEEIAEAAGVIRAAAHAALEELREVIGVLRADGAEPGPAPPQPTLAQVPALIDESRAAGMQVRAEIDASAQGAPNGVGRTAYRVVQEGLTNARKHAPDAAVEVGVHADPKSSLVVEVVSRLPVDISITGVPGAGAGLIGLAERVTLAGGELEHGPRPGGTFVVRATLPWAK
jgi:signal transduction histidine kinase